MSQKRIEKEELKRFIEVNEGVKEQIGKHESQLVETKYYKDLVIETKLGPVSLGETYVTIERNKEGDMEYHFRWVKENDNGEKTIEEKMVLDKDGNVFCIDGLKGALGNSQMDVEELFKENDIVMIFTLKNSTPELEMSAKFAKEVGATVITCCCIQGTSLEKYSDLSILGGRKKNNSMIEEFNVMSRLPLHIIARTLIDYLTL